METVCIFGLGYVGREVAAAASEAGFSVIGVDTDPGVIADIKSQKLLTNVDFDRVTTDGAEAVTDADIIIAAVPTPVNDEKIVDLTALKAITDLVAAAQYDEPPLYIVESTIPPGTISDIVVPKMEEAGKDIGEDIFVAHAPERINPGTEWSIIDIPRVVGAVSDNGSNQALDFYENLIDAEIHETSSPAVAEASKIIENAYRDVNIAFVNEIALALDHLDIDVSAALDAADTKPFGFKRFNPGTGVGGHCVPIDPYFLIRKSASEGFNNRFLKYAREVNDSMPSHIAQKTIKALNEAEILPKKSRVVLLGAAFKSNVEDTRNSPYYDLKSELEEYGVTVETYDPNLPDLSTVETPYISADAVILVTAHDEFQSLSFDQLASCEVEILVDGRNVYSPNTVRDSGLHYIGVGR